MKQEAPRKSVWEEETIISFPRISAYTKNLEIFSTIPIEAGEERCQEKAGQREEDTMEGLNILHLEWQKNVCSLGHMDTAKRSWI